MKQFLGFVVGLVEPLYELFVHVQSGKSDAELERQIAMTIVRAAKDEQARREIEGK